MNHSSNLPTGASRLYPIVGDPIAQVRSPQGMTARFHERGLDALCVPAHVSPGDFDAWMRATKSQRNVDGILITFPHKFAALQHCEQLTERARFIGATNVMRRTASGEWLGDMCDGEAFVQAMIAQGGSIAGGKALLVGAGGAGSAIAFALMQAGVASLAIHDADAARRDALIAKLKSATGIPITPGSPNPTGFDVVANATPMGMRPDDPLPIDVTQLTAAMRCACVITKPVPPRWLEAAQQRGCATTSGENMFNKVRELLLEFLLPKQK